MSVYFGTSINEVVKSTQNVLYLEYLCHTTLQIERIKLSSGGFDVEKGLRCDQIWQNVAALVIFCKFFLFLKVSDCVCMAKISTYFGRKNIGKI